MQYFQVHGVSYTLRHAVEKESERYLRTWDRQFHRMECTQEELSFQKHHPPKAGLLSIAIPVYNTHPHFLEELLESLKGQTYEEWEACLYDASTKEETIKVLDRYAKADPRFQVVHARDLGRENEGISGNTNRAMEMCSGTFLILSDHDDVLPPWALYEMAKKIGEGKWDVVYTDEDKITEDGRVHTDAHWKPDLSPDSLRSANYMCHLLAVRKSLAMEVGGERASFDGSQDHDFFLRLMEKTDRFAHIPRICYHWRSLSTSMSHLNLMRCLDASRRAVEEHAARIGYPCHAEVEDATLRLVYDIVRPMTVDVLVVGETQAEAERAIAALQKMHLMDVTGYSAVTAPKGQRWAAMNQAALKSKADVLLFLDAHVHPQHASFVREMLMYAQREDVGGVTGALLSGTRIRHAGFAVGSGIRHFAQCIQYHLPLKAGGWHLLARQSHNVGALSGACLMVRRDAFRPFDGVCRDGMEAVDWSIRQIESGYHLVYTPHAVAQVGNRCRELLVLRDRQDEAAIRKRHPDYLDPCWNPNLRGNKTDYRTKHIKKGKRTDE
ncbi:MAG: glycosyltransferase [Clostridia bacterium]|nr:glycosyltransferase [Clostridia bacterium]